MRRLASIDIGSQTIRLLVADVSPDGKLLPVLKNSAIIRLGESMNDDSCLTTESIERAALCIADFLDQAQKLHPISIYAVATACVRAAKNKTDFLRTIFKKTGIRPTILTGQEEALTALEGVKSVLNKMHAPMIVLDIGGGSTELVYVDDHKIIITKSIPMGVIGCTERYLMHDPPSVSDISTIRRAIANIISSVTGGSTIKYLAIGAIAAIIPGIVTNFLPGFSGILLAGIMVVGGVMLMGKVPVLPQALIVGAGITFLSPIISGFLGGITSSAGSGSGATF